MLQSLLSGMNGTANVRSVSTQFNQPKRTPWKHCRQNRKPLR